MVVKISQLENQKLNQLKELDIQQCSFCGKITILNLGWGPFEKLHCQACQEVHILCPELCLKVAKNIIGCELVRKRTKRTEEPVKPNRPYYLCSCYLCGKELKGAGKHGVIKNRNNPSFWGIGSNYKILCLGCIGKEFYNRLANWQRKKFREYLRRGYE